MFTAMLTEIQIDRILDLAFKVIQGIGYASSILLPALLLYFQKRNAIEIKGKVDESTKGSEVALNSANGHTEKIANLTEKIANLTELIAKKK